MSSIPLEYPSRQFEPIRRRTVLHLTLSTKLHGPRCVASQTSWADLLALWHLLDRINHRAEVVRLQLRVLDALLRPVLVKTGDAVLCALEEEQLVANAFFDEHAASVLVND